MSRVRFGPRAIEVVMHAIPKYLLFASLGLLLLAGVQFVVALMIMCFWSGDFGFDLLVNVWRLSAARGFCGDAGDRCGRVDTEAEISRE